MLYLQELPSYTTERYYLLSEVEQAATFDSSVEWRSEDSTGRKEAQDVNDSKKFFYYIIWNENDGLDTLKKDIEKLCGSTNGDQTSTVQRSKRDEDDEDDSQFFSRAKYFVAIEVLASRESQIKLEAIVKKDMKQSGDDHGLAATKHDISKAHSWIRETFPNLDFVAFGTSDTVAGTPALEILQQIICFAYKNLDPSRKMVRVLRKEALLGHDSDREPDAESDVTQALYTSRPFSPSKTKESKIDYDLVNGPLISAMAIGGVAAILAIFVWQSN